MDILISSPMRRAHENAQVVTDRIGRKIDATLDDLREWDTDLPPAAYVAVEEMGPLDP